MTIAWKAGLVLLVIATAKAQQFQNGKPTTYNERFNYFDTELFKVTAMQAGLRNFVISPASVKALLSMVLEGAGGNSSEQIRTLLRIDEDKTAHRMHLQEFLRSLSVRHPGIVIAFANRVYVTSNGRPRPEYEEALKTYYYSGIERVNFDNTQLAAITINDWVSKNTHGLIRTLVRPESLDPQTKVMLLNTIYFKGKWEIPFDPQATHIRCFYTPDKQCKNAYFMESHGLYSHAYINELNAQALQLPYQNKGGSEFSMILIYPHGDIKQLLRDLSFVSINRIISMLETTTVIVSIPRFSIEYDTNLIPSLYKLDLHDIFQPTANLTGMLEHSNGIYINNVLHKAIIEINEEGTTGAAVTGSAAIPLMGSPLTKFHANKPFLFFVRDSSTGNYLFEGQVVQPELADGTQFAPPPINQQGQNAPTSGQNAPASGQNVPTSGQIAPTSGQHSNANQPNVPKPVRSDGPVYNDDVFPYVRSSFSPPPSTPIRNKPANRPQQEFSSTAPQNVNPATSTANYKLEYPIV